MKQTTARIFSIVALAVLVFGDIPVLHAAAPHHTILNVPAHLTNHQVAVAQAPAANAVRVVQAANAAQEPGGSPFPTAIALDTLANGAHSVRAADLDRDGRVDVIAASREDGRVVWHRNLGGWPAQFAANTLTTAPGAYMAIPADLNNDGWQDVVLVAVGTLAPSAAGSDGMTAPLGEGRVIWLQNRLATGQGFVARSIAEGLNYPVAIHAADLDGDGDIDLIVPTRDDGQVTWYENLGGGAFRAHAVATGLVGSVGVHSGDIDGDGHLDVIVAVEDSNQIFWFRNNGATPPSFEPHLVRNGPPPPTGMDYAKAVFAADVDQDGDLDVVFASEQQNQVGWYENLGAGAAFTEHIIAEDMLHAKAVYVADVDRDGDLDILAAASELGAVVLYENRRGTPLQFVAHVVTNSALGAHSVVAADIDGDGAPDLLSASRDDDRVLYFPSYLSHRTALFDAQSQYVVNTYREPRMAAAADIDKDGRLDIISASDAVIAWHRNEGGTPPRYTAHVVYDQMAGGRWVHAADLDGDGDLDLVSADNTLNTIIWYENLLTTPGVAPGFTPHVITTVAAGVRDVRSADIDGDGDLDLYSASDSDNTVAWYEQRRSGRSITFVRHIVTSSANYARSSYAADLDLDGDIDLMSASVNDNSITWYENHNHGGEWVPHTLARNMMGARHIYADDLDHDGDPDIIAGSEFDNTIAWFENRRGSPASFEQHIITRSAMGIHALMTGDVDQDGDMDIFAALESGARIVWYENNGAAVPSFTEHTIVSNFPIAHSVNAADVDGDGDLDAIATSREGGQVAWFENSGGQYSATSASSQVTGSSVQTMLALTFAHKGRVGDAAMRVNALTFRFTAGGQPLTSAQAASLFSRLYVYQDSDANGTFNATQDKLLTTVDMLNLDANGALLTTLPASDPAVQINVGGVSRYFLVADTLSGGCLSANSVQITHVSNSRTVMNSLTGYPMRAEYMRISDDGAVPDDRTAIDVVINELMADNTSTLEDPNEPLEYPDWIELRNGGSVPVSLGGMYLSDDPAQPQLYKIPDGVTIPARGYLVFIADGEPEQGPLHANFKLSRSGETVTLIDTQARAFRLLDQITYEGLGPDVAYGRYPDGSNTWRVLGVATPGAYNFNEPFVVSAYVYMPYTATGLACR